MSCIDLGVSTYCAAFAGNYVLFNTPTGQYIDSLINSSISGGYAAQMQQGCPGFNPNAVRYHITQLCGYMVFNNGASCTENANKPATAHQMCSSTEAAYLSSFLAQTQTTGCNANSTNIQTELASNNQLQAALADSAGCITSTSFDSANCGFGDQTSATAFCLSNPTQSCCASLQANTTATVTKTSASAPIATRSTGPLTLLPQPTTSAPSDGNSSSSVPLPVIIGAAAGGVVLLVALIIGVILVRRRKTRNLESEPHQFATAAAFSENGTGITVNETMESVYNYVPNLSDEIYIYVGDSVLVKNKFDDGWAFGYNLSTKQEGTFPLACLAPLNDQGRISTQQEIRQPIRQRGSSLYAPSSGV
ncbi:uncharacterized protein BJ171DRAFT_128938 [Polychytrium aggregatum]|uniref:uncharacterized protein n=1 Tax=Polychytrium aggregatum TaxID=110093 RepID=UPI0022FF3771|nr:uncharacterized protein BJ171DRAFT_128938 [Polychytrium aggregatum]KAI9204113.1 hypothetical protein BJ171DRAFT_128938 [Polychytrium aggregatum]